MEPTILYEDNNLLAINKPAGLVVHSDGKTKEPNLVDWLVLKYPEIKTVGEHGRDSEGKEVLRSGIVHRLDRDTSGVMLVAKTQEAFENLKSQFQNHEVEKTYHAFVLGEMKTEKGVIDRPIGRSSKDFRMWSAQRGARGELREAITEYKVLAKKDGYTFVEVKPKTGRTHQIRVHFKAINHSLVGDSLYAPTQENKLGFARTALHSYRVNFSGLDGQSHTITAPYPEDFSRAVALLQSV
ncbi:MAG: Ribosomal large subunit pseudouridine synthase D [Parcubacteria bacterium C7867-006]|nr:MAG: Ribosomal large subunit pseudouridine synthase D [Parcubacteria bacterium C7867-006]